VVDRHRVQCVEGADRPSPEERIVRIGGTNTVGVNWRLTQDEAISGIEGGRWDFFVLSRTGRALDVIVAASPSGRKYLKTSADEDQPDQLLALKACG
jgi:hypothetical protein